MFSKDCPKCGQKQTYKWKQSFDLAIKKDRVCYSCSGKQRWIETPKENRNFANNSGKNNPMYGKAYYECWVGKYAEYEIEEKRKQHAKNTSLNQGKGDTSVKKAWVKKFGKEEGERRWKEKCDATGKKTSGSNNGMFGKSPGKMAGRGIRGRLDNVSFRSLLELQFIYFNLMQGNRIESAERKEFRVYFNDGNSSSVPDFLINESDVIELKPSKLVGYYSDKINRLKQVLGDSFSVKTEKDFDSLIDKDILEELLDNGRLVFFGNDAERARKNLK